MNIASLLMGDVVPEENRRNEKRGQFGRRTGDSVFDTKRSEFDKKMSRVHSEIGGLHNRVNEITAEIRTLSMKDENRVQKDQLIGKINQLKNEKEKTHMSKSPLYNTLRECQDLIKKKQDELNGSKERLGFRNVEEVTRRIEDLEQRLESGSVRVSEEPKTLSEINKMKKIRKSLEELDLVHRAVDDLKKQAEACRKMIQEKTKQGVEFGERISELGEEISRLSNNRSVNQDKIRALIEERDNIRGQIDSKNQLRQELQAKFREAQHEHDIWMEKEARRKEKLVQKHEIERTIKQLNEKLRELEFPPCVAKITQCENMEKYLRTHVLNEVGQEPSPGSLSKPAVSGIDQNLIMRNKNVRDDQENYYYCPKVKNNRKARYGTDKSTGPVKLPLQILVVLEELRIRPPTRMENVDETVQQLLKMKQFFEAERENQTRTIDDQRQSVKSQIDAELGRLGDIVIE